MLLTCVYTTRPLPTVTYLHGHQPNDVPYLDAAPSPYRRYLATPTRHPSHRYALSRAALCPFTISRDRGRKGRRPGVLKHKKLDWTTMWVSYSGAAKASTSHSTYANKKFDTTTATSDYARQGSKQRALRANGTKRNRMHRIGTHQYVSHTSRALNWTKPRGVTRARDHRALISI